MNILQIVVISLILSVAAHAQDNGRSASKTVADSEAATIKIAAESMTESEDSVAEAAHIVRFVTQEDVSLKVNTETTGNKNDNGIFKWLISKDKGSTDIELGIGWLKPGEVHLLHHHTTASEFYYILKGSATITSGEEVQKVYPGTAVYIPAGDSHEIVSDGKETLEILFGYNKLDRETIFD